MPIHLELEDLYYQDKEQRETMLETKKAYQKLEIDDKKRLNRVKEILPQVDLNEIWNCHYLALLFQHGETAEDYKRAHEFAKRAVDMGSNVTKWLYEATYDRWQISEGKPQKYGTQFKIVNGKKIKL